MTDRARLIALLKSACGFLRATIVTAVMLAAAVVNADPTPSDEPTAAIVDRAPLPGDESGRVDADPGDSSARKIVRGALFVPRTALTIAFAPVEGAAWVYERFQLTERAQRLFFNDAMTMGLFPTFALESGFGLNIGARFVHHDMFGHGENIDIRVGGGGRYHDKAVATFRTGKLMGEHMSLELGGLYESRAKEKYYGIGNDERMPEGRYRNRTARVTATFDRRLVDDLHVLATTHLVDHEIADGEAGTPITEVYAMDTLAGFGGMRNAYGELELRYDSRRRASEWEPVSVLATGWLADAYAGRITALEDGADFWRYGMDLQKFTALGAGPRVLILRTHGEAVTGETTDVPFIELPRIGGGNTLRGYAVDRFRDRVALTGSAEYQWDLSRFIAASLFVDAGKVAPSVSDLDLHDLRVGYGASIELHSARSFLARATVASSIDGGLFFNVGLDPVFELEGRTERR